MQFNRSNLHNQCTLETTHCWPLKLQEARLALHLQQILGSGSVYCLVLHNKCYTSCCWHSNSILVERTRCIDLQPLIQMSMYMVSTSQLPHHHPCTCQDTSTLHPPQTAVFPFQYLLLPGLPLHLLPHNHICSHPYFFSFFSFCNVIRTTCLCLVHGQ